MGILDRGPDKRRRTEEVRLPIVSEQALRALQQENDSLKQLVVRLSEMVIRQVAGQR